MRLSVPMVAQDNAKYGYRDALQELKYCGFDVPERKEITNENIRFYAWLCRMAVSMLKLKDCEIKRLENEKDDAIKQIESLIEKLSKPLESDSDREDMEQYRGKGYVGRRDGKIVGLQIALDILKPKDGEQDADRN